MATREMKALFHDGAFVPDEAIELVHGLTDEHIAAFASLATVRNGAVN
ncbi:MAG: hypothetical protein OXC31_14385 [Spirochaetaceae bacterium]|nr:hypothetical protein [Spirochaetaceae bacterium]